MGDLRVCSSRPHGVLMAEDYSFSRLSSLPFPNFNPDSSLINADLWATPENTTSDILRRIQPTSVAEKKREQVIDYVQRLITSHIGCEVFPYGSVPLKTYLPDGDVDLTALCCSSIENAVVSDVHAVLKRQEHNGVSHFEVKDVYCIDAEVKLVKCIVENIVVDISFNQLGGLCTLCFLERVDRLVGKNHLFKRSIILIKAWCYYESRILGAHHGLISTYALETLVLYIFHLFHASLHGPLAVLHRFLEYFSKFDWENCCISLRGPVSKSSLPDIVAEIPENSDHELLLGEDFLRNCMNMFSVSSKESEPSLRVFPLKHLNIIDPLKENNNLGRSVNRGNFYRIRSAFKYGARKLGWILLLPEERIEPELNKFFANTLDRHGWTNAQFPALDAHFGVSVHSSALLETSFEAKVCPESTLGFRDEKISETKASFSKVSSSRSRLTESMQKLDPAVTVNTSSKNDTHDFSSMYADQINVVSKNAYSATQKGPTSCPMTSDYLPNDETCFTLLDLSGDYDSYIRNLRYGQICDSYASSPTLRFSPPMSAYVQKNYPWPVPHRSIICNHNIPSRIDRNGFTKLQQPKPLNHFPLVSEGMKRPQGIGTYFPKTNTRSYRDVQFQAKGKTQGRIVESQLKKYDLSNKLCAAPRELSSSEGSLEFFDDEFPVLGNGKSGRLDSPPSSELLKPRAHGNGLRWPHEEPKPICHGPWGATVLEAGNQIEQHGTSDLSGSSSNNQLSDAESPNATGENKEERDSEQFYHLKNDEDFPPLSH